MTTEYGPRDRLAAELSCNAARLDHEPVTASSLTYGDLRAMNAVLYASAHKLSDLLREYEPIHQPDDGSTEFEITVEDARKVAWAVLGSSTDQAAIFARLAQADGALGRAITTMVHATDASTASILGGASE